MGCALRRYLRFTRFVLVSFALMLLVMNAVLLASDPIRKAWPEVGYLDLLLCAMGIGCYVYGFLRYRSRHRKLALALRGDGSLVPSLDEASSDEDIRFLSLCLRHEVRLHDAESGRLAEQLQDQRDLLTKWAHDVKTPLSVCQLVIERPEAEPVREALNQQFGRIQAQVGHVLHLERLHHLERSLVLEALDVRALIRASISRGAPLLQSRGLMVNVECGEIRAMGDGQCVGYVLDQLMGNAAKYAPEDSELYICAYLDGQCVAICVVDQGEGIPAQDIHRVFEKGFVGEKRKNDSGQSTGMGLYYAERTAVAMGGRIMVASRSGRTEFRLELPIFQGYLKPASR